MICKKCDGRHMVTKYCANCKRSYCQLVKTNMLIEKGPQHLQVVDACPECGAKSIVYVTED